MEMLHEIRLSGRITFVCSDTYLYDFAKSRGRKYLRGSRYIVYEQVVMFQLTIRHNCQNFLLQNVFQLSSKTLSHHFRAVLCVLRYLQMKWLNPFHLTRLLRRCWRIWSTFRGSWIVSMKAKGMHIPVFVPIKKVILGLDKKTSVHRMSWLFVL